MDPLLHVFSLLKIDHQHPARLDAGGSWALRFPGSSHIRFGAAVAGTCWLTVDGEPAPLRLDAGDGYLLTRGQPYELASELDLSATDGVVLFRANRSQVRLGSGKGISLVSGRFTFDELSSDLLPHVLPPVVHLRPGSDSDPVLRAAIEMLDYETRVRRFGASLVTHHVAQIMLVESLRHVAASAEQATSGWLGALADPRIGMAMQSMHEHIHKRWTVIELAKCAGMSRSIFALRFKQLTGYAPLDYLLQLRMRRACQALRSGESKVATIAYEIGYQSESAFSNAFKRVIGTPPTTFRSAKEAPAQLA
ncbi:MAG: cupin domain-containing protein [Janthinobacterium lividum]